MYPVLAEPVAKAHCKTIPLTLGIDFDVKIGAVQSEHVSCDTITAGSAILGDRTVIDFE